VPTQKGFTFAAGNASKAIALPRYAIGALRARSSTRDPHLWVFGSGSGLGEGALALHDAARDSHDCVWLATTIGERDAARSRGMRSELKNSRAGYRLTLRAGVIVLTHGFGDVNRFVTHGAVVVQLWHGIPLKHIQLDARVTFRSGIPGLGGLLRRAYRRSAAQIALMPAASEVAAERLRTAFGIPASRIRITGDPRDDVVLTTTREDARAAVERVTGLLEPTVILYAPTWRDGEADPAVPTADEWQRIDAWLAAHDANLVVRPHPHGVGDYAVGIASTERVRLMPPSALPEVNATLPAFDVLITDYSSIAFDFSLLERPIAFLAPDADHYARSRGLYEPYSRFSGGAAVATWDEVLALLSVPENLEQSRRHAVHLGTTHHAYRDGRNTVRVLAELRSRLKEPDVTEVVPDHTAVGVVDVASATVTIEAPTPAPATVALVGSRAELTGTVTATATGWSAHFPLRVARWGAAELPAPSGRYILFADGVRTSIGGAGALVDGVTRVSFAEGTMHLAAPLTDDELGTDNQARLEADYRSRTVEPANAVFFESFYGQNASCNPRAIDAQIARELPATVRYWSVVDASVVVPDGAVAVVEGSAAWWNARAESRLLVVNDWLRKRWRKRPHQLVLQTWHGTMLKKIANDRPRHGLRATIATMLESRRWDVLLAQNPHSERILRRAYAYRGAVWREGYPRDDALAVRSTDERAADGGAVRDRLGIAADSRVVLYAPTWRDDRIGHIDHLDVAEFARQLGDGYVVLIRGHARTLQPGRDVTGSNVIDVTGYPDVTDLFLAADLLVTDYSSVMFDFSVTGKPIFFFTPDLDHYRESLRGFYFDLAPVAPGPIVSDPRELVRLVAHAEETTAEFADRYAAWSSRFNPHDDGHAAERVVARLRGRGALG
jgi:CDP-glycerol glycerophosphotransferase